MIPTKWVFFYVNPPYSHAGVFTDASKGGAVPEWSGLILLLLAGGS